MDKELFETGLKIRSEVLGKEYVENSLKSADEFNMPFQEFVTAYCWGGGWGRPGLTRKQRSVQLTGAEDAVGHRRERDSPIRSRV